MAGFLLTLWVPGCAVVELHQFEKHAATKDDRWIAGRDIRCGKASNTCSRLHLIKGEACLRLARSGRASAKYYGCAADALAQGLALQRSWPEPFQQQRVQEHLCESLAGLQRLQSDEAAAHTLARLADAAAALYRQAPDSIPAIYYLSIVRLREVEPRLAHLAVYDRMPVCTRLKRTLMTVLTTMETAKSEKSEDWMRWAKHYERLAFQLGSAINTAQCR